MVILLVMLSALRSSPGYFSSKDILTWKRYCTNENQPYLHMFMQQAQTHNDQVQESDLSPHQKTMPQLLPFFHANQTKGAQSRQLQTNHQSPTLANNCGKVS